jgi:hypothetical protein
MDKLDRLVTERLLTPEQLGGLLADLMERQVAKTEDHTTGRVSAPKSAIRKASSAASIPPSKAPLRTSPK